MAVSNEKKDGKFIVMNLTDGIPASLEPMSREEAEEFKKNFPKRFKAQGYYLTSGRERIKPEDVKLEIQPDDEPNLDGMEESNKNTDMDSLEEAKKADKKIAPPKGKKVPEGKKVAPAIKKARKVLDFKAFKKTTAHKPISGKHDLTKKHMSGEKKGDKGIATLENND